MRTQDCLPATAPEIAAEFEITTRAANSRLQDLKHRGIARRTDRAVPPTEKHRGRYAHIWELVNAS